MWFPVSGIQGQEQRYRESQCFCGRWNLRESRRNGRNPVFPEIGILRRYTAESYGERSDGYVERIMLPLAVTGYNIVCAAYLC